MGVGKTLHGVPAKKGSRTGPLTSFSINGRVDCLNDASIVSLLVTNHQKHIDGVLIRCYAVGILADNTLKVHRKKSPRW